MLLHLDEQSLHGRTNIWLCEERTGSFNPQHALQHLEPLLQQVRRVSLQVVHTLPRHYLHATITADVGGGRCEGEAEITRVIHVISATLSPK